MKVNIEASQKHGLGGVENRRSDLRPLWLEVDLRALERNYAALLDLLPKKTRVIASLKANAYGLGVVAVASVLERLGVYALAMGSISDAIRVRRAQINARILLFGGHLPTAASEVLRYGLIPTVHNIEGALALSQATASPCSVYIKVDSGLGRLGVPVEEALAFILDVRKLPRIRVEGVYTHLPFVDGAGELWARRRLTRFFRLLDELSQQGIHVAITQAASSPGILAGLAGRWCTAVCPGVILYGVPHAYAEVAGGWRFEPVLHAIKTRLIQVTRHPRAHWIGVGGHYHMRSGGLTGVVPVGRNDGYGSTRRTAAAMLLAGRRVPVIGVSLEHATLDLSEILTPAVGDEVVVLGRDGREVITLEEMAAWQDVSPLEVLIHFSQRTTYHYLCGGERAELAGDSR